MRESEVLVRSFEPARRAGTFLGLVEVELRNLLVIPEVPLFMTDDGSLRCGIPTKTASDGSRKPVVRFLSAADEQTFRAAVLDGLINRVGLEKIIESQCA